jgi:transglutaminase-like putative cysteine protease
MLYDIRLRLHYDYERSAGGGRHHVRVVPVTLPGVQRVVASSLAFSPRPAERGDFVDFFGTHATSIAFTDAHEALDIRMKARVAVNRPSDLPGLSVALDRLPAELDAVRSLGPSSPHHFLTASKRVALDPSITAYAEESRAAARDVEMLAHDLCRRIHKQFVYDGDATSVDTPALVAFHLGRGVCQDFSHIMIAGLRGLGIPAGYVSGFLRTTPPPGRERLEGADAMHAWVSVWCGRAAGWREFDPTNGIRAGDDHITVGHGRDYADVAPIVGVLRTAGGQAGEQQVDVVPVEEKG